jgi:hypothetical protein
VKPIHSGSVLHSTTCFKLIHSDLCDSMSISSLGKTKYIVLFCKDMSRSVFIYLVKSKSEFSQCLAQFIKYIKT